LAALKHFGQIARGEGSPIIIGINRKGNSFTVHHHPSNRVTPGKLARILKHLEITQAEFLEWYN
jgi:predicted RNA binding protein YcfA (HicA-like mRNA interferase family)